MVYFRLKLIFQFPLKCLNYSLLFYSIDNIKQGQWHYQDCVATEGMITGLGAGTRAMSGRLDKATLSFNFYDNFSNFSNKKDYIENGKMYIIKF